MNVMPDKHAFSMKLFGQTVGVWLLVGSIAGSAVFMDCLGVNLIFGVVAALVGALLTAIFALSNIVDKWHLLRWINHFLYRTCLAGPFVAGVLTVLILGLFAGMPIAGSVDARTAQEKVAQEMLLRSAILLGLFLAIVVKLTKLWDKMRHVGLPIDLE